MFVKITFGIMIRFEKKYIYERIVLMIWWSYIIELHF